jgi:hypothetical protein
LRVFDANGIYCRHYYTQQQHEHVFKEEEQWKNYYKKLLGTNQLVFNEAKATHIRQLIPRVISADKAVLLDKEVT